jgi:type I restriction enzyme, S subunit
MIPEIFGNNFHILADAPNGIPKLREMILQLAVRGKLVPQDPNDEPASVLLQKIKAEKEKLIKDGKIKNTQIFHTTYARSFYKLPYRWEGVRLETISIKIHYGYNAAAIPDSREVRLLRITDIQENKVDWNMVPGCRIDESKFNNYKLNDGDILVARTGGTIGKSYLVKDLSEKAVFASYLLRIIPSTNTFPRYIKLFLDSDLYWKQLYDKSMGTGQPNVNGTSLKSLFVPLPPLSEQKRIVAKVDQLMMLCDELKERKKKRDNSRIVLNSSCLNSLTSPTKESKESAWLRIKNNFDLLYDWSENVSFLRQSILQLAVQGKLVPQDPNDEPASVLLQKIMAEKERLIKEGKIKNQKLIPPIDPEELPYDIPENWEWTYLGNATINRDGERIPLSREERQQRQGPYDYYGASGVIDKIDDYLFDKPLLLIGEDGANLINRSTPIAFMAYGKYWVNNHAHVVDGITLEFLKYVEIFINSIDLIPYITGTAQPKMNQTKMNRINLALPPLNEQKRIIFKVKHLMIMCDELETKLKQSQVKADKLIESVVNKLTVE